MALTAAWDRLVRLVEATSAAVRTVALTSVGAGAIVLLGLMRSSLGPTASLLLGTVPLIGPGALIWDFSRTIAKLPQIPTEALETTTDAVRSTGSVITGVTTESNFVARIVGLLRGLFSVRTVIGNLKSLGFAAWWLKRLASPLYLVAVAASVAWSAVLVMIAVIVLIALV